MLGHRPRELSNGQKQRTALGRALVRGPGVLLLDDPLRNVDAKLRYEMRLELPRLLTAFGSAVIYVTQDYREAMALGRRIAVLRNGKFEQIAAPPTVYSQPANLEIARLFGDPTINLFPCRPQAGGLASCSARRCRCRASSPRWPGATCTRGHPAPRISRSRWSRCPAPFRSSSTP